MGPLARGMSGSSRSSSLFWSRSFSGPVGFRDVPRRIVSRWRTPSLRRRCSTCRRHGTGSNGWKSTASSDACAAGRRTGPWGLRGCCLIAPPTCRLSARTITDGSSHRETVRPFGFLRLRLGSRRPGGDGRWGCPWKSQVAGIWEGERRRWRVCLPGSAAAISSRRERRR